VAEGGSVQPVDRRVRPRATQRPNLFRHPWRVAIVGGILLLVLNLAVIAIANTDTSTSGPNPLPATITSISPEPGQLTGLVDTITVDLRNDLTGALVVNGREIPEDQLDRVPELSIVSFRPGPGKDITHLTTGDNTVVVLYWTKTKPRPADPFSYSWRFRAAA
jgi:hypothetical protein